MPSNGQMVTGFPTQYWLIKHNLNPAMTCRDFTQKKLKSLILTAVMTIQWVQKNLQVTVTLVKEN